MLKCEVDVISADLRLRLYGIDSDSDYGIGSVFTTKLE